MSGAIRPPEWDMACVHATVHGDVQGVGFRYFVQRLAWHERLVGWVRNRPDGAVECVAQGPRNAVQRFVAALRQGPAMAAVDRVEARWQPTEARLGDFQVVS